MNIETIKNAFEDREFVENLFSLETPEEVQEALRTKGIEMSEEDICAIRDLLIKIESGEISNEQVAKIIEIAKAGELSEEALEQVSGGAIILGIGVNLMLTGYALAAILGGTAASTAAIGGIAMGIIDAVKNRW